MEVNCGERGNELEVRSVGLVMQRVWGIWKGCFKNRVTE